MDDVLRVSTLGGLKLEQNHAPLAGFHSRKADALVVYLATTRQPQPREALADLLWDEDARATANLRVLLTDLRQLLAPFFLITRSTVELNPSGEIWCDASTFESQLDGLYLAGASNGQLNAPDANALENALALYHGDFLKGFYIRESPRFEEWVLLEQERLRRRAVNALQRLTNFYLAQREYVRGIETASRLFEIDPLNELTQQQLMELLARSGEPNAALAQFEKYKQLLAVELCANPSPETAALRDQIRAGLFTEKINTSARSNLPRALTAFVGRAAELAQLDARLRDPNVALVTLIGTGGVGKTRLALRAAENAASHFRDGVTFIALAALTDANLVLPTLAEALGVLEKSDEPLLKRIIHFLRDKEMLLLIDNCEQVLDAAPQLTELLSACPHVKILATSREKLRVYGEHEFPVAPFSFPDPAHLADTADLVATIARYPAVALFVQRANAAQPHFALHASNARIVAEICARLDGLPLAIELAAARMNELPFNAILARLAQRLELLTAGERDRTARQQSLRGALDWSYVLLDVRAKKMLRAMSVFAGGSTLDAAGFVAQTDAPLTLNLLTSLVDKSLVQRVENGTGEPRFTLLESIRAYAQECAAQEAEASELAHQHALYFQAFAHEAEAGLIGPAQVQWLEKMERDLDNVRAALQWCVTNQRAEIGLQIAHGLGRFWAIHNHWAEGRRWLETLLALDPMHASPRTQARGYFSAGWLANFMTDFATAHAHFERAQQLAKAVGDELLGAQILFAQSSVLQSQNQIKRAETLIEQAFPRLEKFGAAHDVAWGILGRATVQLQRGRFLAARANFERALAEFQRLGDYWSCAVTFGFLGFIARFTLQRARASEYKAQALALFTELGDHARIGVVHFMLGAPSNDSTEYDAELSFFQEKVDFYTQQGNKSELAHALLGLAGARHRRGDEAPAQKLFGDCLTLCLELDWEREAAECVQGLAGVAAAQAQPLRAARLFGAADASNRLLPGVIAQAWRGNYGADLAAARAQLTERAFDRAWAEGRAWKFEQAIEYALEESLT